jgi:molybdopterin synthase sulfur carrier subunit
MIVKFIGALRRFSGAEELAVECKDCTSIGALMAKLVKDMPGLRQSLFDQQLVDPRANALIIVNGREISVLDGFETKLKDGDQVVFIPIVHGG